MLNQSIRRIKKGELLAYLVLLTGFFIFFEISFFVQCNKAYLADYSFIADHLHLPLAIIPSIICFVVAQLAVHFFYCLAIWYATISCGNFFSLSARGQLNLCVALWVSGIATILAANQYWFPHSRFSALSAQIIGNDGAVAILFIGLMVMMTVGALVASSSRWIVILMTMVAVGFLFNFYYSPASVLTSAATSRQPNIIIVGVDSLRPDFLSYFGSEQASPFIDEFLEHATVFSEAVTPLARTFPSWSGILTGEYPRQTGIRSNLAKQRQDIFLHSLPSILRRYGYATVFATDETRFSNIDKNYGFDQIVTPPMGLNDFLLGSFNDFPLSNLLVNTAVGHWLFPYSYANRPAYFLYEPDSFLHLIQPVLWEKRTKPLFLAIHFCLPHQPYLWANSAQGVQEPRMRYAMSVARVDRQLHDFFVMLTAAHVLDHAIVVLLSDHGEALALRGDRITEQVSFVTTRGHTAMPRFYPPSLDQQAVNQSAGHGTDVLSWSQNHTLLSVRLYGMDEQYRGVVPGVTTLLGVKPMVLDLIGVNREQSDLAAIVMGKSRAIKNHTHIFLESDFSPAEIRTVYPKMEKIMLVGAELFEVNSRTTRLTVRDQMAEMIISSKQYADIYGDWMLALYPQHQHDRMPILINLVTGEWSSDLYSSWAKQAPLAQMLEALRTFYGNELA